MVVENLFRPTVLRLIKLSKTDLFMGKTRTVTCPVSALLDYLVVHGGGPLFKFKDGQFLTRQRLVVAVKEALQGAGLDLNVSSCFGLLVMVFVGSVVSMCLCGTVYSEGP